MHNITTMCQRSVNIFIDSFVFCISRFSIHSISYAVDTDCSCIIMSLYFISLVMWYIVNCLLRTIRLPCPGYHSLWLDGCLSGDIKLLTFVRLIFHYVRWAFLHLRLTIWTHFLNSYATYKNIWLSMLSLLLWLMPPSLSSFYYHYNIMHTLKIVWHSLYYIAHSDIDDKILVFP